MGLFVCMELKYIDVEVCLFVWNWNSWNTLICLYGNVIHCKSWNELVCFHGIEKKIKFMEKVCLLIEISWIHGMSMFVSLEYRCIDRLALMKRAYLFEKKLVEKGIHWWKGGMFVSMELEYLQIYNQTGFFVKEHLKM